MGGVLEGLSNGLDDNFAIDLHEIVPTHAWFTGKPCRYYDEVRVAGILVIVGPHNGPAMAFTSSRFHQIERNSLGAPFHNVN